MLNLNLYEGILKLSKYKLYKSPYKESIDEVWEVINKLNKKNRINFLKNLLDLKIEHKNAMEHYNTVAQYDIPHNKIYLTNGKDSLNHELFHMASSKTKRKPTGISLYYFGNIGKCLNEGITEYLHLKSKNTNISDSGYQAELFVIEVLIFMFGEQILESYFNNDGNAFLEQFSKLNISSNTILKLDEILRKIDDDKETNFYRTSALILSDLYPNIIEEDKDYFKQIKLDSKKSMTNLNAFFAKYQSKFNEMDEINISEYQFKDKDKKEILDEYQLECQTFQREKFSQILDLLIEITKIRKISFDDIYEFINKSLFYKDDEFKKLYTNTIYEKLELQNTRGDINEKNISNTK